MTKRHIEETFEKLKETDDKAFIAYIMAGDGGLDTLPYKIKTLVDAGVDLIEIGIPFSDPAADGPVIQKAGIRALEENVSLRQILKKLREIKDDIKVPYVLMTYYNPVFHYGLGEFTKDAEAAGVSGVIVPDVPLEEEPELKNELDAAELAIIRLATLTTSDERLEHILDGAEGFIYAVTVNGVTGKRAGYSEEVFNNLKRIKSKAGVPVCAGFGITSAESAAALGDFCDGVIVGSRIVEMFHRNEENKIKNLIPKKHASHAK